MHEMAIAESLLEMATNEASKNGCNRITAICVQYGQLSGIMPEALTLCVEMLIKGTINENMNLQLQKLPLKLLCPFCNTQFGGEDADNLLQPCPNCGEDFGHIVLQGKELILAHLEAVTQ